MMQVGKKTSRIEFQNLLELSTWKKTYGWRAKGFFRERGCSISAGLFPPD